MLMIATNLQSVFEDIDRRNLVGIVVIYEAEEVSFDLWLYQATGVLFQGCLRSSYLAAE